MRHLGSMWVDYFQYYLRVVVARWRARSSAGIVIREAREARHLSKSLTLMPEPIHDAARSTSKIATSQMIEKETDRSRART